MSSAAAAGKSLSAKPLPSTLFFNRRAFLAATGAAALALSPQLAAAQRVSDMPDPSASLYPAKRNEKYALDRPVTDEKINTNYNNFYEFGSTKKIARAAQALKLRPWTDQARRHGREGTGDRHRRSPAQGAARGAALPHRCVEAWSMAVPWSGFPMAQAGRDGEAAVVGEIRADGNLPRSRRSRPGSGSAGIRGPMSRG